MAQFRSHHFNFRPTTMTAAFGALATSLGIGKLGGQQFVREPRLQHHEVNEEQGKYVPVMIRGHRPQYDRQSAQAGRPAYRLVEAR